MERNPYPKVAGRKQPCPDSSNKYFERSQSLISPWRIRKLVHSGLDRCNVHVYSEQISHLLIYISLHIFHVSTVSSSFVSLRPHHSAYSKYLCFIFLFPLHFLCLPYTSVCHSSFSSSLLNSQFDLHFISAVQDPLRHLPCSPRACSRSHLYWIQRGMIGLYECASFFFSGFTFLHHILFLLEAEWKYCVSWHVDMHQRTMARFRYHFSTIQMVFTTLMLWCFIPTNSEVLFMSLFSIFKLVDLVFCSTTLLFALFSREKAQRNPLYTAL